MILRSEYKSKYSTSDIQFAMGIVISNAGYSDLATKIIEFQTQKSYGLHADITRNSAAVVELQQSRDAIDQAIETLAACKKWNIDYATIYWFFTEPIIGVSSTKSTHRTVSKVSLQDRMGQSAFKMVYSETMKILLTTRSNALIVHYISTSLFEEPFKRALGKVITDKFGRQIAKRVTNTDYNILREDFKKIYSFGLTRTSDAFTTISGDPNSALCGAPVKIWYANNKKSKLQSIVFGQGQDLDLGDGSVSRLNLKELNDDIVTNDIDFIDLCTKINKASSVLFWHTGVVSYDIFSHHCDRRMNDIVKKFHKDCESIYHGISFETELTSIGECINQTHLGKIKTRCEYANYLDDRFAKSVTASDLEDICKQLYEITRNVRASDGCRLFAVDDSNVHKNGSESNRFETLLNGYKALYQLIDYIDRNESTTGISINDFPVIIFRDSAYLKRFHTFEEYVHGYKAVKQLLDEIKFSEDPSRTAYKLNGFLENERVGDILANYNSIKFSKELNVLGEKPVSFFYNVTHATKEETVDDRLATVILDAVRTLSTDLFGSRYPFIPNKPCSSDTVPLTELGYFDKLRMLNATACSFIKCIPQSDTDDQGNYNSKESYVAAIQFLYLLEEVQKFEKAPIRDEDGFFVFDFNKIQENSLEMYQIVTNALKTMDPTSDTYTIYSDAAEALKSAFIRRLLGLVFVYNLFFHTNLKPADAANFTVDHVYDIYYSYSLIKHYIDRLYNVLYGLHDIAYSNPDHITRPADLKKDIVDSSFMISIHLVKDMPILEMPKQISSYLDIVRLVDNDLQVYIHPSVMQSGAALAKHKQHINKISLMAFNYMLKEFSDVITNVQELTSCIKVKLANASKDSSSESVTLLATMEQLNREILCDSFIETDKYKKNVHLIQSHATSFNEYGFMCIDGSPVAREFKGSSSFKRYYHYKGAMCKIENERKITEHAPLDDGDIAYITSL